MSNFKTFAEAVNKNFKCESLYVTAVNGDDLWALYLSSFPPGTDPIYKECTEHTCNCCRHFIRHYGNLVNEEGKSIWNCEGLPHPYNIVAERLAMVCEASTIVNVFKTPLTEVGTKFNFGKAMEQWNHFWADIGPMHRCAVGTNMGEYVNTKNVFARALTEFTEDGVVSILELIDQGSIYRGEEFKQQLTQLLKYLRDYKSLTKDKELWLWNHSQENFVARIRNTAIGTLLIDVSAGVDLDDAVTKFEKVMAPSNYRRPKAIITKEMIKAAEDKIIELGYADSLGRRYAVSEDVSVENVLFVDRAVPLANRTLLGELSATSPSKAFNAKVQEIGVEDFIKDVVPNCETIEVMLEGRHEPNFVSLIAPENKDSKSMFKWNNGFSWSYNGDVADSMKQRVKEFGGRVDGVLRFSIQWNEDKQTNSDYDAHCIEPNGREIYFGNKLSSTGGNLDVDIIWPYEKVAVENITWPDKRRLLEGEYKFAVHCYSKRSGIGGFSAEVEFNGQIFSFNHPRGLKQGETVVVTKVKYSKADGFEITGGKGLAASKEIWGLNTNDFVKVSLLTLSPNHWGEGVGNKHYLFMLDKCKNPGLARGFYNEFLKGELVEHKRVFEALGDKMRVRNSDRQLSGLGFSSTQTNDVLVRVKGKVQRLLKVVF